MQSFYQDKFPALSSLDDIISKSSKATNATTNSKRSQAPAPMEKLQKQQKPNHIYALQRSILSLRMITAYNEYYQASQTNYTPWNRSLDDAINDTFSSV